ncbi:hypothetical protein C8Q74DRAFT_961454 [Fomes fomentarius]|nr:hypothetical protein C8Q74DRAFT_961454 [Fomes fomentarius]
MGDICLSVAPILRCQSLSRLEAGILLLPPAIEIVFASVLLWAKRGSADKKHVFLAVEVIVYFLLAVLDMLIHTLPNIGTSLDLFRSLDIVIGVGSFITLFLYTFALYLLTTAELVPSLPVRFQNIAKYVLIAFIPLIVIWNELASFVGITYRIFPGNDGTTAQLGAGFANAGTKMFLGSITLVLLTIFQASNFCVAFYRLVKALSHQRSIDSTQTEKEMEAHLFRGLGWIVVGLKLGAIETVIGFASGGFGIAFTRRFLRLLGHGCLIIGIVKGIDTVEDFQLYSPGEAQMRRKSMLRAMIQNPRFSTFRHVGGHDFEKQNPFDEKHNSVIKLGDPSWMRRDFVKPALVPIDEERATPGLLSNRKSSSLTFQLASRPSIKRKPVQRDSTSSFGSSKRNSWPHTNTSEDLRDEYEDVQTDAEEIEVPAAVLRDPLPPREARQRVTVHIRPDRLPVLELRRFSNLEFLDLVQDPRNPFRDPHARARSLPNTFERPAAVREPGLPSSVRPVRTQRDSFTSNHSRAATFANHDRPWSGVVPVKSSQDSAISFGKRVSVGSPNKRASVGSIGSQYEEERPASMASFIAIGSPSQRASVASYDERPVSTLSVNPVVSPGTISSWVSPGSRLPSSRFGSLSRRERGLSSSTTASDVHALAMQFPGIPLRPSATPARRSMLSHEIPRTEFIAGPDYEPMPEPESMLDLESAPASRSQTPPTKHKPTPLMTKGLVDERISGVEIEQVMDDDIAMQSLPTPESAPRYRAPVRTRMGSRLADVPTSASASEDDETFEAEESRAELRRVATAVKREASQDQLVRVKSVGSAPMRSVSASHRTAFARDSIKVELGHLVREGRMQAVAAGQMTGTSRYSVVSDN